MKKKLRKKSRDSKTVSITLPEDIYLAIKLAAKDDIRSVAQQVRYYMEIGMQVVQQQMDGIKDSSIEDKGEGAPAIGFTVGRYEEEYD